MNFESLAPYIGSVAGIVAGYAVMKIKVAVLETKVMVLEKSIREAELSSARSEGTHDATQDRIEKVERSVDGLKKEMEQGFNLMRTENREERDELRELILALSHKMSEKFDQVTERLHRMDKSKVSVDDMRAVSASLMTPAHGMPAFRPKKDPREE